MKDYRASLEKLREDAVEAALIRDLATDTNKREMFDRIHRHLNRLADEVEQALTAQSADVGGFTQTTQSIALPPDPEGADHAGISRLHHRR